MVYTCADPPSTNNSTPATKLASSDARNTAALPISSGRPILPRGTIEARWSFMPWRPSSLSASPSRIGVSIGPGLIALTVSVLLNLMVQMCGDSAGIHLFWTGWYKNASKKYGVRKSQSRQDGPPPKVSRGRGLGRSHARLLGEGVRRHIARRPDQRDEDQPVESLFHLWRQRSIVPKGDEAIQCRPRCHSPPKL
jgi:hypothetical protein